MEGFTRQHERRGYGLVEAAIVLGVVGIVIGGTWVAANEINWRMTKADIVKKSTILISEFRSDFKNNFPTTTTLLNDYAKSKDLIDWPILLPGLPWKGLKTPDGASFLVYYNDASAIYAVKRNRFSVTFGTGDSRIERRDCYYYLNAFNGYYAVINGHGDDTLAPELKDPSFIKSICDSNNLTGSITLIFDP